MTDFSRPAGEPPAPAAATDAAQKTYHCGPLQYSLRGLLVLFGWLLWGDFCFTLMETVGPQILPLRLKALGLTNTHIQIIVSVLPLVLNMTVCPWVSFRSDRHRGRWGRRIPFILSTMPFLVLCLALVGWSDTLAVLAQRTIPALGKVAPATVTVALIAVFYVAFKFFDMFVGSVYWYLFNDVVPPQFLGRFMGLFRMVNKVAIGGFQFFVLQYARTNLREIFTGIALLYLFGVGMMCLRVKEGPYPPPPEEEPPRGLDILRSFGRQCFSNRFYVYFYLMNAFAAAALACNLFTIFFYEEMGLTLREIGRLNAITAIASLVATYFAAVFVDRWHPLRISAYNAVFAAVTGFGGWIWVAVTLPSDLFLHLAIGGMLVVQFGTMLAEGCSIPLFMRLMPKGLYGQFSAANAMIRSLMGILAGLLAGVFLDVVKQCYHGSDFAYRWIFVWPWVWGAASAVFLCLGYREWKRLGGDDNFRPPAPWVPGGFEEVADKVRSVVSRPRAVMVAMWLTFGGSVLNVLFVGGFMWWMHQCGLQRACLWYLAVFLPIKLFLTLTGYVQLADVRRDILAHERGQKTRMGVPHHGVLLVNAIQGLAYFPVFWYQTVRLTSLHLERELILFGIANLLATAAILAGVQVIRWLEREDSAPLPASAAVSPN
jgi:hypothetical protein